MKKTLGFFMLGSYWLFFLWLSISAENFFYTISAIFLPMVIIPWEILRGFFVYPGFSIMSILWLGLGLILISED